MATKISTSSLRVTIHEQIRLKGQEHGTKNVCYVPDIATVSKRIIDVPTSEVVVASFSTAVAAGTFIESDVMYIRITNLDDTNFVYLVFKNEYNNEFCIKLDKGKKRPINDLQYRMTMLQSIKYIDKVIPFDNTKELRDTVKWYRPNIIVMGSDWKNKEVIGEDYAEKLIFFERVGNYSTTKMIRKK